MKIMGSSFRRSHAGTATLNASNPAAGDRRPTPLRETPGHSQASLGQSLVGLLLLLLGPGAQGSVRALQGSVSQSCVSSGGSMLGLLGTCSKRAYAIPRSAAPRAPAPAAVHCWPVPRQETPKHSSGSVSVGSLGPGAHNVCLSLLSVSGGYGAWFWMQVCPSYHFDGASLPLDVGYILTVAPAPHSQRSSTYRLPGASPYPAT